MSSVDENKLPTNTIPQKRKAEDAKSIEPDPNLPALNDDPRIKVIKDKNTGTEKIIKQQANKNRVGRNSESFDPASTLVRPDLRILVGPNREEYKKSDADEIKHDDIVIVPEFFCKEDDWDIYYKLIEEMRESQREGTQRAEWISWHEGAHLISQNPKGSKLYNEIQAKISRYFGIQNEKVGTRFNWYRDSSDWKPFHVRNSSSLYNYSFSHYS